MMFSSTLLNLSSATLLSSAAAMAFVIPETSFPELMLIQRAVVNPEIVYPEGGTIWHTASLVNASWDTSNVLQHNPALKGRLLLGYSTEGSTSEHLDLEHPLADSFDLISGIVSFSVPEVPSGEYFVVLMGDSGNRSPSFRIDT